MRSAARHTQLLAAAILCLLATRQPASAAAEKYEIDTGHSTVGFTVRHFFTKVPGTFTKFTGAINIDPEDLSTASVTAEIDPSSVNTNHAKRDEHLRGEDFFWVEKHPTLTFTSTKVTREGEDGYKVEGELTMRGVARPVTLDVTYLGGTDDPWGNFRAGYEATTTIDRKDFGITWNKALDAGGALLGDEINITISLEVFRKKEAPAEKAE